MSLHPESLLEGASRASLDVRDAAYIVACIFTRRLYYEGEARSRDVGAKHNHLRGERKHERLRAGGVFQKQSEGSCELRVLHGMPEVRVRLSARHGITR